MRTYITPSFLFALERGKLITRHDGKPKKSLLIAAEELRHEFYLMLGTNSGPNVQLIYFYNMGALIQFQAGKMSFAYDLCRHGLQICRDVADGCGRVRWLAQMIQPYINLGRLYAAEGDAARSLSTYRNLYDLFFTGRSIDLEGCEIKSTQVDSLQIEAPDVKAVVRNAYIYDSIRALLLIEDYIELIKFIDRLAEGAPLLGEKDELTLLEARYRAFIGMKDSGRALEVALTMLRLATNLRLPRIGIYALAADIYTSNGRSIDAQKILHKADTELCEFARDRRASNCLYFSLAYRLALSQLMAEEYKASAQNANIALKYARDAEDEPASLKALVLLMHISTLSRREGSAHGVSDDLSRELSARVKRTFYRIEKAEAYLQLADRCLLSSCQHSRRTLAASFLRRAYEACAGMPTLAARAVLENITAAREERLDSVWEESEESGIESRLYSASLQNMYDMLMNVKAVD